MPTIKMSEVKLTAYARSAVNMDRVVLFALLMDQGVKFPPIALTRARDIEDGRTRFLARQRRNETDIDYILSAAIKREDILSNALAANAGGSAPPTDADVRHVVLQLLEIGLGKKAIVDRLPFPEKVSARYYHDARIVWEKQQLGRAKTAVLEDRLTVPAAAKKYGIQADSLKKFMAGGTKPSARMGDVMKRVSVRFRADSRAITETMARLTTAMDAGEVSPRDGCGFVNQIDALVRNLQHHFSEHRNRFNARLSPDDRKGAYIPNGRKQTLEEKRKSLCSFLTEHESEPLTYATIARRCGVSETMVRRYSPRHNGNSPSPRLFSDGRISYRETART